MHSSYPRLTTVVVCVVLLLALSGNSTPALSMQQTPAAPPQGGQGTQVVPDCDPTQSTCNTYEYGGAWVADPATTMTGSGGFFALIHQTLPDTSFQYFETPWVANHVADNESLMQGFVSALLSQMGQVSPSPLAIGTMADGTLWHLYAVPVQGTPHGMLFTVDTADSSQNDVSTVLTSPSGSFDQALTAVQIDVRVNGASPLAGIDPAQLTTALGTGMTTTPVAGTTPAIGTPPPSQTPPSEGQNVPPDQSVTVGTDTIAYGGEWTYDTANSGMEIAGFRFATDPLVFFAYGHSPDRMSGGDVQLAVQILDPPSAFEAQNVNLLADGTLPSGRAYVLYTWERGGTSEVALFMLDVTSTPGTLRAQMLFAPPAHFETTMSSVQQSFQINGIAPFDELDPAELAPLTGGTITVAGAQITYTDRWTLDTVNSETDGATYLDAADGSGAWFGYYPEQAGTGDTTTQLAGVTAQYFQNIGATNVQQLSRGTLTPTTAWELSVATSQGGESLTVLTYADTASAGELRVELLYSVQLEDMASKLMDAQAGIRIDGEPAFAGVEPVAVAALLGVPPPTPGTDTTPPAEVTPTTGAGGLTLPPLGATTTPTPLPSTTPASATSAGQSITVAGATITYTDRWTLDTVNSETDGVTYFDAADGSNAWVGYLPAAQPTTGDAATQLAGFNARFLQDIGVTDAQQQSLEAISPTSAWSLTTATQFGVSVVLLTYANTDTPGTLTIQILYSQVPADVPAKLMDAQGGIQIGGVPAFAGVDPGTVATLLGGTTTPAAGTTPSPATSEGALYESTQYGYSLTYDPAVWSLTPDDDGDAEEWIFLDSETSTVTLIGRPNVGEAELDTCVTSYLVDQGWDDSVWEATPIEPLRVEPGRAIGMYALEDQLLGTGTAYMFVECRDIGGGNTLLISHFAYTDPGEAVPADDVAAFEQLIAGLVVTSGTSAVPSTEQISFGAGLERIA